MLQDSKLFAASFKRRNRLKNFSYATTYYVYVWISEKVENLQSFRLS